MDEAEHVAMVLPGGECSANGRLKPAACQWEKRGKEEGSVGSVCVSEWRRGCLISQIHTRA